MKFLKSVSSSNLFRCLVVPTILLSCIFKQPVFQWVAVAALAVWLSVVLTGIIRETAGKAKQKKSEKQLATLSRAVKEEPAEPPKTSPDNDLFLIRQINYRITEQLKGTYPMVSWLWVKPRPSTEELCKGGTWRIRISNAEPFNFGEVAISKAGRLSITMLQATPLTDAKELKMEDDSDLKEDELLDRTDVKSWYQKEGGQILTRMIDDLNTQGHRKLLIHEDGEVFITSSGSEQSVEKISSFPSRMVWEEFCQVLGEDDIKAAIKPEGLALSW